MKKIIVIFIILFFISLGVKLTCRQSVAAENDSLVTKNSEQKPVLEDSAETDPVAKSGDPFAGLAKKISLDLRSMDIMDTIKFLSKQGDLNMVATKNVSGKVTLFLKDVSIAEVLEIILLANNLASEKKAGIITIMTENEYEALYGEKYTTKKQSKTIMLKYADPKRMGAILGNLKSSIGKVIIDEATGMIILVDTPEKIKEMEDAIKGVDLSTVNRILPTKREVFELQYAKVAEIKGELTKVLTKDIGTLEVDERTNRLVVTDLPHNFTRIRDLVQAFDVKTKEVLIDVKIVEVSLSDDYSMGVNWKKVYGVAMDSMEIVGTFPYSTLSTTTSSLALNVGTLATDKYEVAFKFIKEYGKLEIVSSPRIVVCNNEEAKFMVGSREAYVTTSTTTGEVTTTTAESVQFIDVGVTLYVTPTINSDGFIKVHIKPEVSSVTDWLTTTEGNKIPIVASSNVETDVLVKDGKTIILAGLIKDTVDRGTSKVPILGNLPLLGKLFKTVSDINHKSELAIFITPHIISGEEDLIAQGAKEKIRKPFKK